LTVLMLRGPQTPGELRARTERLHRFDGGDELRDTIERLVTRELAASAGRRPGQKEERYAHQLTDAEEAQAELTLEERVARLESAVERLEEAVQAPDPSVKPPA
jgi:uncharacterized protein YceH (UPF0502 family)